MFSYEPTGNPFICLQLLGTSKVNLPFHFPNSGNARKRLPEFHTETLIIKRSDIQLLVKLNYLTRKIKLKKVIRRFDVSKIIINFDISKFLFLIMMFET